MNIKRKYVYMIILVAVVCLTMGLVAFGMKGAKEVNTTEPETEPTETATEAPTESETATEAPTESATEAPTEKPTEPPTEPATEPEPEIEIAIKARDTMLEGTPVEVNTLVENYSSGFQYEELNPRKLTAPIKNGTEYDYQREFIILTARSLEEFKTNFSSRIPSEYKNMFPDRDKIKILEKYNESYFEKQAVLILCLGGGVDEVVKNGSELCIGASTLLNRPGDMLPAVFRYPVQFIEVNQVDLDGIDTISFFVKAANTQ